MSKIILLFIGCALLCFIPTHTTHAATFDICTLAELTTAITTANGNGEADTINFNCSTTLAFTSQLAISSDITITANGNTVIFDGGNTTRFFRMDVGASLTLNGFTFQTGSADVGGAIRSDSGILTINNSTFMDNFALNGGAIYVGLSTVTINDTAFIDNSSNAGGSIYNDFGTVTINNSAFTDNFTTAPSFGGAIINFETLSITNSTFTNNLAIQGGAIYHSLGTTTITSSTFTNNLANSGGAIFKDSNTMTITDSLFTDNVAQDGGAIYQEPGVLTITGSTFRNNSALFSGGAISSFPVVATVTSQDSHYENNTCSGSINNVSGNTALNATGCPGTAPIPLDVSPIACVGNDAAFSINAGDANFDITGTGPDLPLMTSVAFITLTGPATWTGVTVTERRGDRQFVNLGDITCSANTPLSASATCIGADLQVTITAGDPNFQITADSGTLLTGLGMGVHTITGPVNETNVNVTELAGDTENFALGSFNCFVSSTLTATATCNGADLEITISNGNAPFSISVTDSVSTMNSGGQPLGVYIFTGPDTFTNIGITEDTGDLEVLNLPDVTCTAPIIIVPPPAPAPILPPDPTALGCELTSNIDLANAPDDTYCRILMKDGAVIGYSGAIPADLIGLGVILAVDVYRLEGGMSINTFPNYARVCLAGQGRLFYMDGRQAPRVAIELATETEGSLTCGWIPAPGTLILTN